MKYIYHYYVKYEQGDTVTNVDGLLACEKPVLDMNRYREIKEVIAKDLYVQTARLTIRSLSFLHTSKHDSIF